MSPDFYFFQASFRSHLNHPYPRAERKFRKGASLFSGFLKPEGPPTNAAFKNVMRRGLSWQKTTAPQPAKTYNNRRTFPPKDKTTLAGRNLSQERHSLLGQIERLTLSRKSRLNCRLVLISASPLKLPFHPRFEILHLPAGTFRSDARRKPSPLMRLSRRTGIWRR